MVSNRRAYALAVLRDDTMRAHLDEMIATLDATTTPTLIVLAGAERLRAARRVGVLAGSFNPPTLAHVQLAANACALAHLDVVLWSISRVTVDKEAVTHASLPQRLALLTALSESLPQMAVGFVNRGLYAEQAAALRLALPATDTISFIVGFDKIVQIVDRRYYADRDAALHDLFSAADLLVAPRDDATEADLTTLFARDENMPYASHIRYLPLAPALRDLASSDLRARIAAGQPIDDAVPPEALALIDVGAYQQDASGS